MQAALFGPQSVDVLLDIAKTGAYTQHALAVEALEFMKASGVDGKLFNWKSTGKNFDPMLVNAVKAQQRLFKTVAERLEKAK